MPTQPFRRPHYKSFRQYWRDLWYLLVRPVQIHRAMHHYLSHTFRERLMMVVTEVNQCRYCKSFHLIMARLAGISDADARTLTAGDIPENTPDEEIPALLYAGQWAENHALADPAAIMQLQGTYGKHKANAIDLALRMIWIGNLSGNTWDYWLYRLSFGRLGQ